MIATSAVWPLYVAIAHALTNDAAVAARLGGDKVYSLKAPGGVAFDYVVLGSPTEEELWLFMSGGSALSLQVHLWCAGVDAQRCAQLHGEMYRVLNGASLDIGAPFSARSTCALRLVDIAADPHDAYVHGVERLDMNVVRIA